MKIGIYGRVSRSDGVQEVARLPKSVTIESVAPPRVAAVGTIVRMDKATANALTVGAPSADGPKNGVVEVRTDG